MQTPYKMAYEIKTCDEFRNGNARFEQIPGSVGITHPLICKAPECKYGNRDEKTNVCKTQGKYRKNIETNIG